LPLSSITTLSLALTHIIIIITIHKYNYNDNNNNKDDLKNTYWNGASWEMKWNAHNGDVIPLVIIMDTIRDICTVIIRPTRAFLPIVFYIMPCHAMPLGTNTRKERRASTV